MPLCLADEWVFKEGLGLERSRAAIAERQETAENSFCGPKDQRAAGLPVLPDCGQPGKAILVLVSDLSEK